MVYIYNEILFSIKQEGDSDTCYNTDEPWRHSAKWNKPVTKGQIAYDLGIPLLDNNKKQGFKQIFAHPCS